MRSSQAIADASGISSNTTTQNSCPNLDSWTTSFESLGALQAPTTSLSVQDEFEIALERFVKRYRISDCELPGCEPFRKECRTSIPSCNWGTIRDWLLLWVPCWCYALSREDGTLRSSCILLCDSLIESNGLELRSSPLQRLMAG